MSQCRKQFQNTAYDKGYEWASNHTVSWDMVWEEISTSQRRDLSQSPRGRSEPIPNNCWRDFLISLGMYVHIKILIPWVAYTLAVAWAQRSTRPTGRGCEFALDREYLTWQKHGAGRGNDDVHPHGLRANGKIFKSASPLFNLISRTKK